MVFSDFKNGKIKKFIIYFCMIFFGIIIGWFSHGEKDKDTSGRISVLREKQNNFEFINPLIGFEVADKEEFSEYRPLENALFSIINNAKEQGMAKSVSVYFRDLNSGRWTGVNEDEKAAPASMLKIALMIGYLKQAELDPLILNRDVVYLQSIGGNPDLQLSESERMIVGQKYNITDLLYRLIVYSDNNAKNLLHANINPTAETEVFNDFGLKAPDNDDRGDIMSAKTYSIFFRTLYNASYLSRQMSEAALEILSKSEFSEGIVTGVPSNIKVAHKFGHRVFQPSEYPMTGEELHDCGIVYSKSPYFLCVMTKGDSYEKLKQIIVDISKVVYAESGK